METPTTKNTQLPIVPSPEEEENKEQIKEDDEEFAEQVEKELCQKKREKKKDKIKNEKHKKSKHNNKYKYSDYEKKDKKKDKERNPELEKEIKETGKRLQNLLALKLTRLGIKFNPNKVRKGLRKQIWREHKCKNHKDEMKPEHKWHNNYLGNDCNINNLLF